MSSKELDYREIIKENIRLVIEKRERFKERANYYDWIIANLVADLRDYEGRGRWLREPRDKLWAKYEKSTALISQGLDEFFKHLFEEFFKDY